jgi:sulfatase modifying factor 1
MLRSKTAIVAAFFIALWQQGWSTAKPVAATTIPVDVTLYRRHQACLADVRGVAGRITALHLVPTVANKEALDGLMVCVFWDGCDTPYIACSLRQLLALLDDKGRPVGLPELDFGRGFKIFLECLSGPGGRVQGNVSYASSQLPVSSKRARFDPDLGITHPQQVDLDKWEPPGDRLGCGEAFPVPNAGFESGRTQPWRDASWEKGCFRIYPSGTEGVRAHTGRFMAGTVVPGEPTRGCRGLARVGGLVPGYRYRLSAWINTFNFDQQPEPKPVPWNAKVRLGLNTTGTFLSELYPEGGDLWTMDFSHPKFYFAHCWGARDFADSQDHWSQISVEARARGEVASLVLDCMQLYGHAGNRKWCLIDDVTLDNVPLPMGTIEGRVTGARRSAMVTTEPWGFRARARTDQDGSFRIEAVPEGVYTVEAREGVNRASVSDVRVLAGRSTAVELTLGKSLAGRVIPAEPAVGRNELVNGDFESGDDVGWQRAYRCEAMDVVAATRRVLPSSGRHMFGGEHVFHQAGTREIVYQRVPVPKGSRWTLSGMLFAHSADGSADESRCQLVADPAGGADFTIASDYHNRAWANTAISFVAEAETVTVGVAMERRAWATAGLPGKQAIVGLGESNEFRADYSALYCDDLRLVPAAAGAPMAEPSPRPGRPTVAQGGAPTLPNAETAVITLPDGKTTMELVRVPAGMFLMGGDSRSGWANDDEFPRHHVQLGSYWIGKYEVTNAQYKAFRDDQHYPYPPDPAFSKVPWAHPDRCYNYGDYLGQMPDYPVVNVTWHDAQAFCRWAGLRLPTEAEWEMAARGHGDSLTTYPWGEQTDPAWTTRTRDNTCIQQIPDWFLYTAPIGSFETGAPFTVGKSVFGVCSLGGNVREWCADWYGPYSAADQENPKGPATGIERVLRGGSWHDRDYGVVTRCSYRDRHRPDWYEWGTTGFRVAGDAP